LTLVALILFKVFVLVKFGFEYTDSDQTIMWNGAYNYSQGLFHEPRFYGQAYNSMLESLFAAPLLWLSVPPNVALPAVTTILSILPFLILSFLLYFKKSKSTAIIILCIPLLLPIEYHFISCLSRGFTTGIAVLSTGFIVLFYPQKKWGSFTFNLISVIAFSINPNSAILAIPSLCYLFIVNFKSYTYYIYSLLGIALGMVTIFSVDYFYIINPNNVLHLKAPLIWVWESFYEGLNHMDLFFNDLSFIMKGTGWISLILLAEWGLVLLIKNKNPKGLILLLIPAVIFLSLGIPKVHDGYDSVFFSWSRMYLALPVAICLCIALTEIKSKWVAIGCTVAAISSCTLNALAIEGSIANATSKDKNHIVEVIKIDQLKSECKLIASLAKKHNVDLIVLNSHEHKELYNYACSSCEKDFPKTLRPAYERRTWRLVEDSKTIYKTILVIEPWQALSEKHAFVTALGPPYQGYYLIKNNHTPTIDLIKSLNIPVRPF
jgi:hypothetical protein